MRKPCKHSFPKSRESFVSSCRLFAMTNDLIVRWMLLFCVGTRALPTDRATAPWHINAKQTSIHLKRWGPCNFRKSQLRVLIASAYAKAERLPRYMYGGGRLQVKCQESRVYYLRSRTFPFWRLCSLKTALGPTRPLIQWYKGFWIVDIHYWCLNRLLIF
jgi:hypothetical protein